MSADLKDYLFLEAKEKAFEIEIESRNNYKTIKNANVQEEKKKLNERYQNDNNLKETTYKQARSKLINQTRTENLIARNKALVKLLNKTQVTLLKKCKSDSQYYSKLLKDLIFQGMVKMMEDEIIIFCLQRDKLLIQDILPDCVKRFEEITERQLGQKRSVKLTISNKNYLEERMIPNLTEMKLETITDEHERSIKISKHIDDKFCFGGVILKDKTESIICKNTLDLRTEMAFHQLLPEIRKICFKD
jgi:vacuolar-type H+-ATPase subunit E/Vma4